MTRDDEMQMAGGRDAKTNKVDLWETDAYAEAIYREKDPKRMIIQQPTSLQLL